MFKEDNEKIRNRILEIAEGFSDEQLNRKPAAGEWSAMQILDHLQLMENVIARNIAKELARETNKKAMKKPIQITVSRTFKVNAPSYTKPAEDFISLKEMKKKLARSRKELNSIYDQADTEKLNEKSMPHPVFKNVPLTQWFPFVGLHEKRHMKQLQSTLSKLNR